MTGLHKTLYLREEYRVVTIDEARADPIPVRIELPTLLELVDSLQEDAARTVFERLRERFGGE